MSFLNLRTLVVRKYLLKLSTSTVIRCDSAGYSQVKDQALGQHSGPAAARTVTVDLKMSQNLIEVAKKLAAYKAVDDHIKDGQTVGIGSGSTVVYAVERIAERVEKENLKLICIPTSFQAKNLIIDHKLHLSDLDMDFPIDVTIDGCDECDDELNLVKGGGGCLLQEKIVASASKKLVIVADYTKDSEYLGQKWVKGVPLEVSQIGWKVVEKKLSRFSSSVGSVKGPATSLRLAVKKAGPVVTDNSNFIIDFQIGDALKGNNSNSNGQLHSAETIEHWLKNIPGILETGLFIKMASAAYFGQPDGTVKCRQVERPSICDI